MYVSVLPLFQTSISLITYPGMHQLSISMVLYICSTIFLFWGSIYPAVHIYRSMYRKILLDIAYYVQSASYVCIQQASPDNIHTYIHAYHTHMHTYIHTCVPYTHAYIHAHIILSYLHTYT